MSPSGPPAPTVADVWDARRALQGVVRRTPVLQDDLLDEAAGAAVHLKAEHLQRTGSFKVRGAYNKVRTLSPEARQRGILTISAGNAALGAAYAARAHGIACTVVMPARPVQAKLDAVRALGAEVVLHGASTTEMFARADELIAEHGFTLVHPFEQPEVIAGQGTVGLEILEDVPDLDTIYVPASGGGLIAGIALVVKSLAPHVRVIGVQPEGAPAIRMSLDAGALTESPPVDTLADGLIARRCGALNFALIQRYVDDVVLVSDDDILDAMRLIWRSLRMAVEPSGAAALAGARRDRRSGRARIAVVASGANVDVNLLQHAVAGGTAAGWKAAL